MGKFNLRSIWQWLGGGAPEMKVQYTPAGVDLSVYDVSAPAAMKVDAVYSAVKLISEGVARLAISLQRYNDARKCFVNDYDNELYTVLRVMPNANMTSFVMWCSAIQQVLLQGNAYLYPSCGSYGTVNGLTLLSPGSVYYDIMTKLYVVNDEVNGIHGTYKAQEIVHLKNISLDGGYTGLSTIQLAARAMGISRLSDQNTATTLSNGGRMRGILSAAGGTNSFGVATQKQLDDVSSQVEDSIRAGRTVIPVPQDMKFQTISLSPADAQVLESKQMTIRAIARFFRVHPDLIYEGSNNTYKAAEVPNVMFLTQTLEPLLVQIETELLAKLVPRVLWGKRRIRFDREAMYTTDLQTEGAYYEKMLQCGVYTVNELRRKKGQPPVVGGDMPLVSANLKGIVQVINEFH
jgi:HK97 family phage portal protein